MKIVILLAVWLTCTGNGCCLDSAEDIDLLMEEVTAIRGEILRARSNFRRELRHLQNQIEVKVRQVVKQELSHMMSNNISMETVLMDNIFKRDGLKEIFRDLVSNVIDDQLNAGNIGIVVDNNIMNQLHRLRGQMQQLKTSLKRAPTVPESRMKNSRARESEMHDGKWQRELIESTSQQVDQLKDKLASVTDEISHQREMLGEAMEALSMLQNKSQQQQDKIGKLIDDFSDLKSDFSSNHQASKESCPTGFEQFANSCYWFSTVSANYAESIALCGLLNSRLAHVETEEENNFLKLHLLQRRKGRHYLGASDLRKQGVWMWEQPNRNLNFTNWIPGEPNNRGEEHCLVINETRNSKTWNDINCLSRSYFVCELELDKRRGKL